MTDYNDFDYDTLWSQNAKDMSFSSLISGDSNSDIFDE